MRALASSTKWLRSRRMNKSPPSTSNTPHGQHPQVSVAWLGTTRSYTFIEKIGKASANTLTSKRGPQHIAVDKRCASTGPQNQWPELPWP
jgi:hypothetical protein